MKKIVVSTIRLIITLGLLFYLFSKVDINSFISILQSANAFFLFLAFVTLLSITFVLSFRFAGLTNIPYRKVLTVMFKVNFYNNFLPAQLGGDLYKYTSLRKNVSTGLNLVSAVLTDRLLGMTGLILLVFIGLFTGHRYITDGKVYIGLISYVGILTLVLLTLFYFPVYNTKCVRIRSIQKFIEKIYTYQNQVRTLYKRFFYSGIIISVNIFLLLILVNVFVVKSLNLNVDAFNSFVFIPVIAMAVVTMPVSINGMGIREALYVLFFSSVGCSVDECLAMATIHLIFAWIISLIGGGLLLIDNLQLRINN